MTDEEIITKAFNDNACKYEDWKDCCVAMMRDAIKMKKEEIIEQTKYMAKKVELLINEIEKLRKNE